MQQDGVQVLETHVLSLINELTFAGEYFLKEFCRAVTEIV